MGHQGPVAPEAVFCVSLPVLPAVRVQLLYPGNLPGVLRQVGLDREAPLRRQLPQKVHQFIGAGGGEPGGEDGLDVPEVPALLQPAEGFPLGFLRLLLEGGDAVAVHVHLAHVSGDPGFFQLLHQNQRGLAVEGGEHAHPCGPVFNQLPGKLAVDLPGVVRVGEAGLGGEGVGVQPVQKRQVHAHAQHGILGGVEVEVREGLEDQGVPVILHRRPGVLLRQGGKDPDDVAVLRHQIAVFRDVQLPQGRSGNHRAL